MKIIIKLLFAVAILTTLGGCKKEELFDSNVKSYDLHDPGLSNEQVGEVKWIFCLKYGETKYLDIDGEMYKITLENVRPNIWLDQYNYRFYAYLGINDGKISVFTPRYFSIGYRGDEFLKVYIEGIYDTMSQCFLSEDPLNSFIKEFGEGSPINSLLNIYISGNQNVSSAVDADPIEEYRVVFTITKKVEK